MLSLMSTKSQSRDEIEAFLEQRREERGNAVPRRTDEMIEAIIVVYNRELETLEKISLAQDLTPEQHDTLRVVTSSVIALHRALTVQVPGEDEPKDLSGASMAELRKAAK